MLPQELRRFLNLKKMRKLLVVILMFLFTSCGQDVNKYGDTSKEVVYSGGETNLSTHISKYTIDSVVYLVVSKREGVAIIKHGTIK